MHLETRLAAAVGVLVALDLLGGLVAVGSGVNTWGEAWGGSARLAAPLPMIAAQVVATSVVVRRTGRGAAVAGGLLAAACLVSVASGFLKGGLADDRLTPALSAYQVLLLAATAVVGLLSLVLTTRRLRSRTAG